MRQPESSGFVELSRQADAHAAVSAMDSFPMAFPIYTYAQAIQIFELE